MLSSPQPRAYVACYMALFASCFFKILLSALERLAAFLTVRWLNRLSGRFLQLSLASLWQRAYTLRGHILYTYICMCACVLVSLLLLCCFVCFEVRASLWHDLLCIWWISIVSWLGGALSRSALVDVAGVRACVRMCAWRLWNATLCQFAVVQQYVSLCISLLLVFVIPLQALHLTFYYSSSLL